MSPPAFFFWSAKLDAEQRIKAQLDGKFFKICPRTQQVLVRGVHIDHIPDHLPPNQPPKEQLRKSGMAPRHMWTPEEDAMLQRLRRCGWTKLRCASHFGVTEESIRRRLENLRTKQNPGVYA